MRLQNVRRIVLEDYPEDVRPTVEKLALILNSFMDGVNEMSNHKVDYDNLYREIVKIKVVVDTNGVPTKPLQFSTAIAPRAHGGTVLAVSNITSPTALLSGTPFVNFYSTQDYLYRITQITGLIANNTYEITLEVVGR